MIFSKVFKSNPVQTFEIQVTSGGNNNVVAFGPASIINGSKIKKLVIYIYTKALYRKYKTISRQAYQGKINTSRI
jgi:hypothetical protein